jgi:hypothetical protein
MSACMNGLLVGAGLAIFPLFFANEVHANMFDVTIDSTSLSGSTAVVAFDYIDGGAPDNTVNLSTVISNGTQGSTSTTGNVAGTGPWTLSRTSSVVGSDT